MTVFRIEIIKDEPAGMFYAIGSTEQDREVIARSEPIYHTEAAALNEVKAILQRAWPDRSPEAVDPSIGV